MTNKLIVVFFFVLGALCAQQTKTNNEYFCASGAPMWRDAAPADAKGRDAAYKDCERKYAAEREADKKRDEEAEKMLRDFDQQVKEMRAVLAKVEFDHCKNRFEYRADGTDNPACKNIPPDLHNLQVFHRLCDNEELQRPPLLVCKKLLPLSMGKAYPAEPKNTPAAKK